MGWGTNAENPPTLQTGPPEGAAMVRGAPGEMISGGNRMSLSAGATLAPSGPGRAALIRHIPPGNQPDFRSGSGPFLDYPFAI